MHISQKEPPRLMSQTLTAATSRQSDTHTYKAHFKIRQKKKCIKSPPLKFVNNKKGDVKCFVNETVAFPQLFFKFK